MVMAGCRRALKMGEGDGDLKVELEVIACTLEDALAAEEGGATRLEITVDLDQAGLTPPVDLVEKIIRHTKLAARVMVRYRVGCCVISCAPFGSTLSHVLWALSCVLEAVAIITYRAQRG